MPANFNETFWSEHGRQLRRPSLACLKLDSMTYKTLLFQINEDIGFDNSGIWLLNVETSTPKFNSFFDLAIKQSIELAVTPEYSCPWEIVSTLLSDGKFPDIANLWVLGMASINPPALKQIIDQHQNITWIYDEELLASSILANPTKFFDPVCYLVNTLDNAGVNHKTVVIQFKNYPFGGADAQWERNNIILGHTFYVIRNQFESARMVTLICSDTLDNLNFNEIQDGMFLTAPLLLLHIQLNQKPFADNYKLYRNLIFSKGGKNGNKEVICLNWARNVTYFVEGTPKIFNETSGSAIYLKSTNISKTDTDINLNHKKGMYYTYWSSRRTHAYVLNFDEYLYLIENTKASQDAADPTQFNRTGPHLRYTYKWQENDWVLDDSRINDGFQSVISQLEDTPGSLSCLSNNENYLEVERMVQLCSGEIACIADWFTVSNLFSFVIDDQEVNNRVIFTQQNVQSTMLARKQKINNYSILKNGIINNSKNLPVGMDKAELKYINIQNGTHKFLLNLHSGDSNMHATAIYVGSMSAVDAVIIQKKISDLFNDSQYGKTVMVWHETATGRQRIPNVFPEPIISENVEKQSNRITQSRKL